MTTVDFITELFIKVDDEIDEDLYPKSCTFGYCVEKELTLPGK